MSKVFTITEGLENMGAVKTGGQGSVYKGRRIGEIITAIKLLPTPIFTQSEEDKHYRDFTNEVRKLQRVNEEPNPNIVKILSYGVSETGGFPFIEMEFIDGPDLGELLKPPHHPVFTIKEVIKVADHLSGALAHCHKLDVKHGDIKSNNVKYNKHTGNYVLLDFGLAILSDEERRTSLRQAGAIEFMAPEQNEGKMLFETDVYSFGIILFELLAGKVPFPLDGNSETARNKVMVAHMEAAPPDLLSLRAAMLPTDWSDEKKLMELQIPEWLLSLVYKCLQKKPEDRYPNGQALQEFICHHRIYTAEVAGIVKNEDNKWKSILAEKDYELQDLMAIINKQDREFEQLRQGSSATVNHTTKRKGVSRSAFSVVLLLLLVIGGLAVYSLFFHRSVVGAANTGTDGAFTNSDSLSANNSKSGLAVSENQSNAMQTPVKKERKKQVTDTPVPQETTTTSEDNATQDQDEPKDTVKVVTKEEPRQIVKEKTEAKEEAKKDTSDTDQDNRLVRYKVRNKAFFHNTPEESTRRNAFINHWNNAVLKPLADRNGFVYIVYVNDEGQTTKGWLNKDELIAVR